MRPTCKANNDGKKWSNILIYDRSVEPGVNISSVMVAALLASVALFSYRLGTAPITWFFSFMLLCSCFLNSKFLTISPACVVWFVCSSFVFIVSMLASVDVNFNVLSAVVTMGFTLTLGGILYSLFIRGIYYPLIWLPAGYSISVIVATLANQSGERFTAGFYNATHTSFLAYASIVILFYLLKKRGARLWSLPLWGLSLYGMFASGSRGGVVALFIFASVYCLLSVNAKIRVPLFMIGVVFLFFIKTIAAATVSFLHENMFDAVLVRRIVRLLESAFLGMESDGSYDTRSQLLDAAFRIFLDNPVLGVGLDNVRYYMEDFGVRETYTHSAYLELLAGAGLLGFIVYCSIFVILFYKLVKSYSSRCFESLFAVSLLLSILVSMFFRMSYYHFADAVLVAIVMALALKLNSIRFSKC